MGLLFDQTWFGGAKQASGGENREHTLFGIFLVHKSYESYHIIISLSSKPVFLLSSDRTAPCHAPDRTEPENTGWSSVLGPHDAGIGRGWEICIGDLNI